MPKIHPQLEEKLIHGLSNKELWQTSDGEYIFASYNTLDHTYYESKSKHRFNGDGNIINPSQKDKITGEAKEYPIADNNYPVKFAILPPKFKINPNERLRTQIDQFIKNNKKRNDIQKNEMVIVKEFVRSGDNIMPKHKPTSNDAQIIVDTFANKTISKKATNKSNALDVVIKVHGLLGITSNNTSENKNAVKFFTNNKTTDHPTWDVLNNILREYIATIDKRKSQVNALTITLHSCYQELDHKVLQEKITQTRLDKKKYQKLLTVEEDKEERDILDMLVNTAQSDIEYYSEWLKLQNPKRDKFLTTCQKYPNLKVEINYCPTRSRLAYMVDNKPIGLEESSYKCMRIENKTNGKNSAIQAISFQTNSLPEYIAKHGQTSELFKCNPTKKTESLLSRIKKTFKRNTVAPLPNAMNLI